MSSLVSFSFGSSLVRTSVDAEGAVWFCARDVAACIDYTNVTHMLAHVEVGDELRDWNVIDSIGRQQQVPFVNESGLYRILFRSDKPKCKPFQNWLAKEVLPSIRKTGGYQKQLETDNPQLAVMQSMVSTMIQFDREQKNQRALLETQQAELTIVKESTAACKQGLKDQRLTASQVAELDKAISEKMKQNGNPKFIGVLKKQLKAKFLEAPVSTKTIKDIASKDFPAVIEYIKKYHW